MGIPAFYRWLSRRFRGACNDCVINEVVKEYDDSYHTDQDLHAMRPGIEREPNPQGVEFDNLYIDMNGLIHPCSHPRGTFFFYSTVLLPSPVSFSPIRSLVCMCLSSPLLSFAHQQCREYLRLLQRNPRSCIFFPRHLSPSLFSLTYARIAPQG